MQASCASQLISTSMAWKQLAAFISLTHFFILSSCAVQFHYHTPPETVLTADDGTIGYVVFRITVVTLFLEGCFQFIPLSLDLMEDSVQMLYGTKVLRYEKPCCML